MVIGIGLSAVVCYLLLAAYATKGMALVSPLLAIAAFLVACVAMYHIWPGFAPTDDSLRMKR